MTLANQKRIRRTRPIIAIPHPQTQSRRQPMRWAYWHSVCNKVTGMYPRQVLFFAEHPTYFRRTWCAHCHSYGPTGFDGEFVWCDAEDLTLRPEGPKVGVTC